MNHQLPRLIDMRINPDKDVTLSKTEQQKLAKLVQAGLVALLVNNKVCVATGKKLATDERTPDTIGRFEKDILKGLEERGYSINSFIENPSRQSRLDEIKREGIEARLLFARKNVGLVLLLAGRIKRYHSISASETNDIIAEGMIGLMTAIDCFDPTLDKMFSTIATWWINQPMKSYLESKTKIIKMPSHMNSIYKSVCYAQKVFKDKGLSDDTITDQMIADYCSSHGHPLTTEEIKDSRKVRKETISLNSPVGDGEHKTIEDFISSQKDVGYEDDINSIQFSSEALESLVSFVNDSTTRDILTQWYLNRGVPDNIILSNISRKYCLSKHKVQTMKKAGENEIKNKIKSLARQEGIDETSIMNLNLASLPNKQLE